MRALVGRRIYNCFWRIGFQLRTRGFCSHRISALSKSNVASDPRDTTTWVATVSDFGSQCNAGIIAEGCAELDLGATILARSRGTASPVLATVRTNIHRRILSGA